mmetsp:Transcript_11774/g.32234  ORF Transcript_11774/g.32234 Transcript_11774/m.32234 type:complete len:264 (+) Transcript_11774:209-1000(+)
MCWPELGGAACAATAASVPTPPVRSALPESASSGTRWPNLDGGASAAAAVSAGTPAARPSEGGRGLRHLRGDAQMAPLKIDIELAVSAFVVKLQVFLRSCSATASSRDMRPKDPSNNSISRQLGPRCTKVLPSWTRTSSDRGASRSTTSSTATLHPASAASCSMAFFATLGSRTLRSWSWTSAESSFPSEQAERERLSCSFSVAQGSRLAAGGLTNLATTPAQYPTDCTCHEDDSGRRLRQTCSMWLWVTSTQFRLVCRARRR